MMDFAHARHQMIASQLRPCEVNDPLLLDAVNNVPREQFVPEEFRDVAYADRSITVTLGGISRTLLQPMVVTKLIQALNIQQGFKILDIAAGLGYSSAIMAELGAHVTLLEENEFLASAAKEALSHYETIQIVSGDLNEGCFDQSPFDAVLIHGKAEHFSEQFLRQIKDDGYLICFQGEGARPQATLIIRTDKALGYRPLFNAAAPAIPAFGPKQSFQF